MDNLVVNAVAPWQGYLHWIGNIREGDGSKGHWAFADFTLKYSDSKMQEKYITFTVGDAEKVEMLRKLPIGTPLKVSWFPDTTENPNTDRWYPKLVAYNVSVLKDVPAPAKTEKITAPNFPEPQPPLPAEDRTYQPDGSDLPF